MPGPRRSGGSTSTATGRPTSSATAASTARCTSTSRAYRHWERELDRDDSSPASSGRTSRSGAGRRGGVRRRPLLDRRRAVRGHPAAGHLLTRSASAWRSRGCRRCCTRTAARASTCACSRRARSAPATRSSRRRRAGGDDRAEVSALLYLPGATAARARARAGDPRAVRGLAGLVRGAARAGPGGRGGQPASRRRAAGRRPGPGCGGSASRRSCARAARSRRSCSSPPTAAAARVSAPGSTYACACSQRARRARCCAASRFRAAPTTGATGSASSARAREHYLHERVAAGDEWSRGAARDVHARRGDDGPVVLLSAGVGATPVLAMLASLPAGRQPGEVWWIHGARNGAEHAFAGRGEPARRPAARRPLARPLQPPGAGRDPAATTTTAGVTREALSSSASPSPRDFYLCGLSAWMRDLNAGLLAVGRRDRAPPQPRSSAPEPLRRAPRDHPTRLGAGRAPAPRSRSRLGL